MDEPTIDAEPTDAEPTDAEPANAEPANADESDPHNPSKRRETLRALLARDSAQDWLSLKGGSLAVEAARTREKENGKEDPLPSEC